MKLLSNTNLKNFNLKNLNLKNLNLKNLKLEIKKVFNKNNAKILTNIVLLLLFLWSILYVIPEFFVFLFNTFLGKLILVLTTIIVSIHNYRHGIILASILMIIYRSYVLSNYTLQPIANDKTNSNKTNGKEGFTWSQEKIDEFIIVQNSDSPQIVYNTRQLQKYASPSEVDDFLKNGKWPWSDTTQERYIEYLEKNPYVRVYKTNGLDSARKVYNESAILYILKGQEEQQQQQEQEQQEKEEQQNKLPSGWGIFGYNSGFPEE